MDAIAARLEAVTARLEALSARGGVGAGAAAAPAAAAAGGSGDNNASLAAFDELVVPALKTFEELSNKLGGPVKDQVHAAPKAAERKGVCVCLLFFSSLLLVAPTLTVPVPRQRWWCRLSMRSVRSCRWWPARRTPRTPMS
jgi:hypothetical protein